MSEHNITVEGGKSVRLLTAGKYCDKDIVVTAEGGGGAELVASLLDGTIVELECDATKVRQYMFDNCAKLKKIVLPKATSIAAYGAYGCDVLSDVQMPSLQSVGNYAFSKCTSLEKFDMAAGVSSIWSYVFNGCTALKTLILRRTASICSMGVANCMTNTAIAKGTGYIYCPSSLLDAYKAATNWSTYAAQFRALEDYTVDGTVTGELDASKI